MSDRASADPTLESRLAELELQNQKLSELAEALRVRLNAIGNEIANLAEEFNEVCLRQGETYDALDGFEGRCIELSKNIRRIQNSLTIKKDPYPRKNVDVP